jgi:hypothetical protein
VAGSEKSSRRDFIKKAVVSGAGLTIAGSIGSAGAAEDKDGGEAAPGLVPRKVLGKTGEKVPILILGGAMAFDPKYDKILHRGLKEGCDYIDTALVYSNGKSHAGVATFIEQVGREKLWITTKGPSQNATVESYTKDLDTCLEQMRTDHADMYFMHFVDDPKYLDPGYIQMGDRLKKSGKTRFFGLSCHGDRMIEVMDKAAKAGGIDTIMFRYSFRAYGDLELNKVIDACKAAGIGLIAMKTQDSVPDDQENVKKFQSKNFNLFQAKLKAVWADERIDSAISHMDNVERLAENVAAAKSPAQLTMSEFRQLQQIATASAALSCQGCSHICEPHVEGEVKIARTLRYLMYEECYGEPDRAQELYRKLTPAERASVGVDFSRAAAACPQGIDIATRMQVARRKLEGVA